MLTTAVQRYKIQHKIMELLYTKPNQNIRAEILKISEEHAKSTGSTAFLFKGKLYGKRNRVPAKPLASPELQERMAKVLEQDSSNNVEKSYINSYISAILNTNAYAGTYAYLFPPVLHGIIRECVPNFDGEPREADEDTIAHIKKFNSKGEKLLKQRLLKNAVMD